MDMLPQPIRPGGGFGANGPIPGLTPGVAGLLMAAQQGGGQPGILGAQPPQATPPQMASAPFQLTPELIQQILAAQGRNPITQMPMQQQAPAPVQNMNDAIAAVQAARSGMSPGGAR